MQKQKSNNNSILCRLPLEIWKDIFSEFSAKELWKTCSTSRYWSYLIINTLVSRLKKKPLDICRFYGDFLQPTSEPYITCIPFNSSFLNFSYDDYLIHIKQHQPIILGQWASRSVGFVPWCQQVSNNINNSNSNSKNTLASKNYTNKNNLKYYAENPPTLYCWFCSTSNVDKEIQEMGSVSSMYDLPKAENCLLSNINRYFHNTYNNRCSTYSRNSNYHNYYYNSPATYMSIPSSRANTYNLPSAYTYSIPPSPSYASYVNKNSDSYYDNSAYSNNYYHYAYNSNSNSYQKSSRINNYGYNDDNHQKNIKKIKTNENSNLNSYEISIGKGMAKLKYELVNVEENASVTNSVYSTSPTGGGGNSGFGIIGGGYRLKDNYLTSSPTKNSSQCIEGNSKMSINDFVGGINKAFNVVSSKNPQGNYSNLIMDYYNPNLMVYDNINVNPRNISNPKNNYQKPDTIIEVKITELIIHPSAIFA